jgi:hypothetical protein
MAQVSLIRLTGSVGQQVQTRFDTLAAGTVVGQWLSGAVVDADAPL